MRRDYILECCVDSVESAVTAAENGADRLELCSNLIIGGTTPTLALYQSARAHTDVKIHVLIRPRFGDFLYHSSEFEVLYKEVEQFCAAGADGVVIGCLTADGKLHTEQMARLIDAAGGMHVTLHRAFDMCADPLEALDTAVSLGVRTLLTSGQKDNCLAGLALLQNLQEAAAGKINIMPGSGINAAVIAALLRKTSFTNFHMSGKKMTESDMRYRNPQVHMGLPGISEYEIIAADGLAIKAADDVLSTASAP